MSGATFAHGYGLTPDDAIELLRYGWFVHVGASGVWAVRNLRGGEIGYVYADELIPHMDDPIVQKLAAAFVRQRLTTGHYAARSSV